MTRNAPELSTVPGQFTASEYAAIDSLVRAKCGDDFDYWQAERHGATLDVAVRLSPTAQSVTIDVVVTPVGEAIE